MDIDRKNFIAGMACAAAAGFAGEPATGNGKKEDILDIWQRETTLVTAETFGKYQKDGDTRGLASLEKVERAFEKVLREARETSVTDRPAVWSVYNMGYIVKTPAALFAIDLVHRRAAEFAPLLDFSLITHIHRDHYQPDLYSLMNKAGKTVISNFLDNYGAADWRKGGSNWMAGGGYTRAEKTFRIKDVEIRTSLVDHNNYLIDFTTAFEIRVGNFIIYHTGDCGGGSENKLKTVWGRPDLWLFFPGCGINTAKAVEKVKPKRVVFGHLWELAHSTGRLTTPMIRKALTASAPFCKDVSARLWGDRIC